MATGEADSRKRNAKAKSKASEKVQQPKKKLMPKPPQAPPPKNLLANADKQLVPVKDETELYDAQTVWMPPPPPPAAAHAWPQAPMPGSCPKSVALRGLSSSTMPAMSGGLGLVPPVVAPPAMNPQGGTAAAPAASPVPAPPAPAAPVVVPPPAVAPVQPVQVSMTQSGPSIAEQEVQRLKSRMAALRTENHALQEELMEWRKDSAKSREAEQALEQARAARLEAQLRDAQDSEDLVRDQLSDMEKQKSRLESQLSEAKSHLEEAYREKSDLRKHRDLLQRELKDSAPFKAEQEAAKSENVVLKDQLEKLREQMEKVKEENANLKAKAAQEDTERWNSIQQLLERHSSALKASFTSQLTALQELKNQCRDVVTANGDINVQNTDAIQEVLADPQLVLLVETLSGSSDKATLEHAIESMRALSKSKGFVVVERETAETATEIMEDSDQESEKGSEKEDKEAEAENAESEDSDKAKGSGEEKDSDEEKSKEDEKKKKKKKGKAKRSQSKSSRKNSGSRSASRQKRRRKRRHKRSVSTNSL